MPGAPLTRAADADVVYSREIGVDLVLGKCSWIANGAPCTVLRAVALASAVEPWLPLGAGRQ